MSYPIRVRPTALIIQEGKVLLIEYSEDNRVHYNLPGGGAEPGESVTDALKRELYEEACVDVEVGSLAFVYEYFPAKQSGDYSSSVHGLNLIFNCSIQDGSIPKVPDNPDPMQVEVRWISLEELPSIVLYPNIASHLIEYASHQRTVDFIEDHQLPSYKNKS